MIDTLINKTFLEKYQTIRYINKGSFGYVYMGKNIHTNENVAIKFEVKNEETRNLLEDEYNKLNYLSGDGIPQAFNFGSNKTHYILIEELLENTLGELFDLSGRKFSLGTVCVLAIEMIKLIERIHSKNHIHRDIKPDNFMFGKGVNENKLYLIDFGLARKFCSSKKKTHISFKKGKKLTGTPRYCSVNSHLGYEQSRRDDLESIGYLLILFLNGSLPWQGLKIQKKDNHYNAIGLKKESTTIDELCSGIPKQFSLYFEYVKQLKFEEQPDYEMIIDIFEDIKNKYCNDTTITFDWQRNFKEEFENKQAKAKEKSKMCEISVIANKTNSSFNCNNTNNFSTLLNMTTSTPPLEMSNAFQPIDNENKFDTQTSNNQNIVIPNETEETKDKLKERITKLSVEDISPEKKIKKIEYKLEDDPLETKEQLKNPISTDEKTNYIAINKKTTTKKKDSKEKDGTESCVCFVF